MKTSKTTATSTSTPLAPRAKKVSAARPKTVKPTAEVELTSESPVEALRSQLHTAPGTIDHEMEALFEPPKPLGQGTEVFDEYELASMREMEMTAEAVLRARRAAEIKPPEDWDKETCHECGLDIESGRLKLGYFTCIACAQQKEVRSKQFRT
jgi:RNA polymerase-binding transcription factor DksA